jgi:hypothetical protein
MKLENEPSFAKLLSSWPRITAWAGKWSILAPQWPIITHLKQSAYDALLPCKKRFQELDEMWRLKLRPLCGDSYEPDWQRFRPLRLSREVDWSDWLAWLLGTSATGHFAETIFGAFLNCNFISPKTEREEPKGQDCRADIVLQWKNGGQCTSVEVKVDDDNFEKTFETCGILERWKPGVRWTHTILLPEGAKDAWNATFPHRASIRVGMILWRDVAHGLRHSLWEGQEPVIWQAWALAFCRSVEVRLLGLSLPLPSNDGFQQLVMAARWNGILETSEAESNKDMKPEKKAFLREGVQLYAEAKDIVETFETQMVCLLKDTIDGQPSWMQGPIADKPKFCSTGEQRWLYTTIKGKCPLGKEANAALRGTWLGKTTPSSTRASGERIGSKDLVRLKGTNRWAASSTEEETDRISIFQFQVLWNWKSLSIVSSMPF